MMTSDGISKGLSHMVTVMTVTTFVMTCEDLGTTLLALGGNLLMTSLTTGDHLVMTCDDDTDDPCDKLMNCDDD